MKRTLGHLLVVVVGLVVIVLCSKPAGEPWMEYRERAVLGTPPKEVCNSFGPLEIKPMAAAKTKIAGNNLSASFTFKHAMWPGMADPGGYLFTVLAVGTPIESFVFRGYTEVAGHPGEYVFRVSLSPVEIASFYYTPPASAEDIYWIEIPCSITVAGDSATKITHSPSPIGDKGQTHAKEGICTEEWFVPAGTQYTVDIGGTQFVKTAASDITTSLSITLSGSELDCDDWSTDLVGTKYAMSIEDIKFGPVSINTNAYAPTTWGGTAPSVNKLWVEGFGGNSIGFWCSEAFYNGAYVYNTYDGGAITAPYSYNTTQLHVIDMDGNDIDDLDIWSAGHRDIDTVSHVDLGPTKRTLAEWQALGTQTQQYSCAFWDMTNPPDLAAANQFVIDPTSAKAHGLEGCGILNPAYRVQGGGPAEYDDDGNPVADTAGVRAFNGYYEDTGLTLNGEKVYSNGFGWLWYDGSHWLLSRAMGGPYHYEQIDGECSTPDGSVWMIGQFPDPDPISGLPTGILPAPDVSKWEGGEVTVNKWTLSFQHDLLIEIDGWTLAATDRQVSPYVGNIANIEHLWSKDVYSVTTKPIDWTVNNATIPDDDGNFSVTAPHGTLTMALRSNFIARQAAVGAIGAISVPTAYLNWAANSCYGTGNPVEDYEAVYCWRGWGYLALVFESPVITAATKFTCTIAYRSGLTFSDNHLSNSTRQTEYAYDPGTEYTISKEITPLYQDPSDGHIHYLIDLRAENPLDIVTSMIWQFSDPGDYKFWMPGLSRDIGDRNEVTSTTPFYREAPETQGEGYKFFEHFRYAQGGGSNVYSGVFDRGFWWPDETKPNTLEHTGGGLNVVTGATTGLDLTTPYSLEAFLGLAVNACDAFRYTYSAVNDGAAFVDVDGVRLKTPHFFDIQTVVASDVAEGGYPLQVCVKVGTWNAANGLLYAWHTYKVVEGKAHGYGVKSGTVRDRARAKGVGNLSRQRIGTDPDAWGVVEALNTDTHGRWWSTSHEIYDSSLATVVMWEWKTNKEEIARFATREWAFADAETFGADIYVVEHMSNVIYVFEYVAGTGIQHIYTSPPEQWYKAGSKDLSPYALPKLDVDDTLTDGNPAGYVTNQGVLYLYHLLAGDLKRITSNNWGTTWSTETTVISGQNIGKAIELDVDGRQYCIAVDTSGVLWCFISTTHFADTTWTLNVNRFQISTGADNGCQPGGYFAHGVFTAYAFDTGGNRLAFQSTNFGQTWTAVV